MAILSAVGQFSEVAKYHGTMPRKLALAYSDEDVSHLVGEALLEWAKFTYGCGKEVKGLRLTPEGQRQLEKACRNEASRPVCSELAYEHLLILQDIFHFSRMPRYRRMMPAKKAAQYISSDFDDLLNRGYILKMKLKIEGERTLKGYVISGKGEQALKKAKMTS
ncbi:MAG: hypothetical protein HY795_08905 [Desulfovibrio sp.]|nr:hypothetical protein [Desulfovibrio sp.]MBI4958871.1 hypothetical protein [Desulfovibrio sp.]